MATVIDKIKQFKELIDDPEVTAGFFAELAVSQKQAVKSGIEFKEADTFKHMGKNKKMPMTQEEDDAEDELDGGDDEEEEGEAEEELTPAQKKLPPALQKAILKKMKKEVAEPDEDEEDEETTKEPSPSDVFFGDFTPDEAHAFISATVKEVLSTVLTEQSTKETGEFTEALATAFKEFADLQGKHMARLAKRQSSIEEHLQELTGYIPKSGKTVKSADERQQYRASGALDNVLDPKAAETLKASGGGQLPPATVPGTYDEYVRVATGAVDALHGPAGN